VHQPSKRLRCSYVLTSACAAPARAHAPCCTLTLLQIDSVICHTCTYSTATHGQCRHCQLPSIWLNDVSDTTPGLPVGQPSIGVRAAQLCGPGLKHTSLCALREHCVVCCPPAGCCPQTRWPAPSRHLCSMLCHSAWWIGQHAQRAAQVDHPQHPLGSAHSQYTVTAQSAQSRNTVNTQSAHSQRTISTQSVHR
jgi:hypothetical protein